MSKDNPRGGDQRKSQSLKSLQELGTHEAFAQMGLPKPVALGSPEWWQMGLVKRLQGVREAIDTISRKGETYLPLTIKNQLLLEVLELSMQERELLGISVKVFYPHNQQNRLIVPDNEGEADFWKFSPVVKVYFPIQENKPQRRSGGWTNDYLGGTRGLIAIDAAMSHQHTKKDISLSLKRIDEALLNLGNRNWSEENSFNMTFRLIAEIQVIDYLILLRRNTPEIDQSYDGDGKKNDDELRTLYAWKAEAIMLYLDAIKKQNKPYLAEVTESDPATEPISATRPFDYITLGLRNQTSRGEIHRISSTNTDLRFNPEIRTKLEEMGLIGEKEITESDKPS